MKTLFVPVNSRVKIENSLITGLSKKLPRNIAITYSIQFRDSAEKTKKILQKKHKITLFSQILGCSRLNFPKETKAILLIGNGKFHAVSIAYESKLPVFLVDGSNCVKISSQEVKEMERKANASYLNFLNEKKVGILITTKPGQQRLSKAINFKKSLKKRAYLFIGNDLNSSEFDNFGLKSWINTGCPRMDLEDYRIININKIKKL